MMNVASENNNQIAVAEPWSTETARVMASNIIHKYFTTQNIPLTKHHIDSYDQFIQRDLKHIVAASNPLIILKDEFASTGIYKYKIELYVGGTDGSKIQAGLPTVRLNGEKDIRLLFPNEARLRNLTYALPIQADISYRITIRANADDQTPIVSEETLEAYPLCSIPLMLHSRYCVLHGKPQSVLKEMGECPEDAGGYFIIDGSEKVLITKQQNAFNTLYITSQKHDDKIEFYSTIQSLDPVSRAISRTALMWTRPIETKALGFLPSVLEVKIPMVTKPIPLFILFRALGIQSDHDIVKLIFPDMENPQSVYMADLLTSCINAAQPIVDSYSALNYIKQFTKGLSEIRIIDILQNDFFCHIEKGNYTAKAAYLAHCVRSILRVVKKIDPPTDKDDIRNQRLLTSGFLTQTRFQDVYTSWLEKVSSAIDNEYAYHKQQYQGENFKTLFDPGNRPLVLATGFIDQNLMRAFKGKWDAGSVGGGDEAVGVLQALSRISYLDFMSHCRRVVLEFDSSMKIQGPRRLHTSQFGYFCTSETPTGAHIGLTKNMAIFTSISNSMIPTSFIQMLYKRHFVTSINNVTPSLIINMVPVFVNSAIIGYSEEPQLFARFLKVLKGTGCLPPYSSSGFNINGRFIFIYTDEGRPLRPLYRVPFSADIEERILKPASWRDMVVGTYAGTKDIQLPSVQFVDVYPDEETPTMQDYIDRLGPHVGIIEYVDPYEHNEVYVAVKPEDIEPETTHMEIHPSTMLGLLGVMIPFANHNQGPRNQLSGSQSKQALSMYATNWNNRYDNNAHVLCYGEAPLSRTIYQDYIGSGRMTYGHNCIVALMINTGYNQEDGILMNKTALERGMFRNMSYRSYEAFEEDDPMSKSKTRIANPHNVPAWLNVNISIDYSKLDENGIVKPGSYVDEHTAIVGRYMQLEDGSMKDASVTPQVWTKGRVEDVVVMVGNNGLRLVKIRVVHDRSPELGDKFCLTPDHDVLTERGWVPITELNHSQAITVYDEKERIFKHEIPQEIVSFYHTGLIYEIKTQGGGILKTTSEHRIYISVEDSNDWKLTTVSEIINEKRKIYMKTNHHEVYQIESITPYNVNPIGKSVHCLKVSTGIFVARCHDSTVPFFTGNSNRHGQKGTIGMMLRDRDMPRTVDGIVPDLIMNPHAIPSRMTIGQLFEQLLGKLAANLGAIGNATPFMNTGGPHEALGSALEALGLERTGNEILYDGQSGKQVEAAIFMGPFYTTRLKHMTEDKWNARGAGRKEQRTHQPTGGRGNQGGLKIGEMDRDTLIAHGISSFIKESMMERSDGASFIICNGCGTIPIYNEAQNFYLCSLCDGPVNFIGDSPYNLEPVPPVKRSTVTFSKVEIPYATKLLLQEMDFFMNMSTRLLTTRDVARLPAVEDVEDAVESGLANIDGELPVRTYTEIMVPEIRKSENLPTTSEIESQVAALEEEQKKIMEEELELRRRKDALDAGLTQPGVNAALVQSSPNTIGVDGTYANPFNNLNQGSGTRQDQDVNPFNSPRPDQDVTPFNSPSDMTSTMFPTTQPIMQQQQPVPGMSVIPGQQPTASPTIIISTTEDDLQRDGFTMPVQPLGQPNVPQPQPVQYETSAPRRIVRRTKPSIIMSEPAEQTPHTGGDQEGDQEEYSSSNSTPNSGTQFKVVKLQ